MMHKTSEDKKSFLDGCIAFCLENKLIVILCALFFICWGILVAPFDWDLGGIPRDPVPVDAIPDIGENQQIVFTRWMGRSPQDVEDQITYPLTVSLLGIPGVKTVRSYSFFGFSSIYIIFKDDVEFYWSRSRVLEKLSSLPAGTLPAGVKPSLGPDATALGQIFWYTLEGRDKDGNPTGGWDLNELRSIQDWYVRYALLAADGVSEVASVGGFVEEYQIDVDPNALFAHNVTIEDVYKAIKMSNVDVGARTIEINKVEYVIRGLGFIEDVADIEQTVVKTTNNVPLYVKDIATIMRGPALRRGALDKAGAEAVGGVVVVRYGENPLATIKNVKAKIEDIKHGLPKKTLDDGRLSQVSIIPFYDRTGLIYETLGTLNEALTEEILVTIIVVVIFVMNLGSSLLIAGLLPLAVLMCFIAMKLFGVDANIVALSGIAIAIGTMVDMGIVIIENILKHLRDAPEEARKRDVIYTATTEVGSAVLTAVLTTVVGFLPVFSMQASEGKLFKPLAFTKTFALIASVVVALAIIPTMAELFVRIKGNTVERFKRRRYIGLALGGIALLFTAWKGIGIICFLFALVHLFRNWMPQFISSNMKYATNALVITIVGYFLTRSWLPLGPEKGIVLNFLFVAVLIGALLFAFFVLYWQYEKMLRWCLIHKKKFLIIPTVLILVGAMVWLGFDSVFFFVPKVIKNVPPLSWVGNTFPGLGKEFMPPLDEGSFLYMPTTMPHASIGEALDVLQKQDKAFNALPEIDLAVGKIGRVDSPLDPAPISMIETIINYKSEYLLDEHGRRKRFQYDSANKEFVRDEFGDLIEDPHGRPFRQWRDHIRSADDIWDEIVRVGKIPGTTSAPKLQPIAARIVMLQSGMRAPMGVKVQGPDLKTIEDVGFEIEKLLKQVPSVEASAVVADRVIGKPYLEIVIDREEIARYGIMVERVQNIIEIAIGGKKITTTVEGRERYAVRVRYKRELRDSIESLGKILVPTGTGAQIPLLQVAEIRYVRGPQAIKSENTFLTGYVIFDKKEGYGEVDVVRECQAYLAEKIDAGDFEIPKGVTYTFAGSYENQVRSAKRIAVVLPLALFIIFLILYFQFRSVVTTGVVFSGIFVAWAGGFLMLWLYGQPWFFDFSVLGVSMRDLFQIHPVNLSVAVWVGFLALFGIATDNGVILSTYIKQILATKDKQTVTDIQEAVVAGAVRRIRPCLMTSATTILALLPVLTSRGRGSDVMVPMAIPSFGGMLVVMITVFVVPVLYCAVEEKKFRLNNSHHEG